MGTDLEVRMGGFVIGVRIDLVVKMVFHIITGPDGNTNTGSMWPVRLEVIKCPRIINQRRISELFSQTHTFGLNLFFQAIESQLTIIESFQSNPLNHYYPLT